MRRASIYHEALPPPSVAKGTADEVKIPVLGKRKFKSISKAISTKTEEAGRRNRIPKLKRIKTNPSGNCKFLNPPLLEKPIEIPYPDILKTKEFQRIAEIPTSVIRMDALPDSLLKDVPKNVIQTLRADLFSIQTLNTEQLENILSSLCLPSYLKENIATNFQRVSLIYEVLDQEYYAVWLTNIFKRDKSFTNYSQPFVSWIFVIYQSDFTNEEYKYIENFVYHFGGWVAAGLDYNTNFVVFKDTQKIDINAAPIAHAVTLKQLQILATDISNQCDKYFQDISTTNTEQGTETEANDDELLYPVFIPSKSFEIRKTLRCINGIPLWSKQNSYTKKQKTELKLASDSVIHTLQDVLRFPLPESFVDLYTRSRNGGWLYRSTFFGKKDEETGEILAFTIKELVVIDPDEKLKNSLPLLYYQLGNPSMVPLSKIDEENYVILNYKQQNAKGEPSVCWFRKSTNPVITKICDTFKIFIDNLQKNELKTIYGLSKRKNVRHNAELNQHRNYFNELDIFFCNQNVRNENGDILKKPSITTFGATHFYWRNRFTLQNCYFEIRAQKRFPLEFPESPEVHFIILVDPLSDFYSNRLAKTLENDLGAILLYTPSPECLAHYEYTLKQASMK